MNITVIYSTGRKVQSCTYNIAQLLIRELLADDELFEFQLPRDMPHICVGCYACIKGQEQKCGPDPCCHGTVRADHLLHPNVCVPCSGTDENTAGSFRVSLADPPSGSVVHKEAGRRDQYSRRWRHEIHRPGNQRQHRLLGNRQNAYSFAEGVGS